MTVPQLLKRVKALPAKQRDRLIREILALEDAPASRRSPRQREAAVK